MSARYASVWQVKQDKKIPHSDSSGDVLMAETLSFVCGRIDKMTGREFAPWRATKRYHAYGAHIDEHYTALYLGAPLLAAEAVVVGGVTLAAYNEVSNTGDYYVLEDRSPYFHLCLAESASVGWNHVQNEWRNSIRVTATWGYRSDYPAQGWRSSGTTLDGAINASVETLTVTSALIDANTPRFSPGQMLRIDSEWFDVLAVNTGTRVLTVSRAFRGSTAAAHNNAAAVEIWTPEPAITRAALRWAAFLYARAGEYATLSIDSALGTLVSKYPADAPEEIARALALYEDLTPQRVE